MFFKLAIIIFMDNSQHLYLTCKHEQDEIKRIAFNDFFLINDNLCIKIFRVLYFNLAAE